MKRTRIALLLALVMLMAALPVAAAWGWNETYCTSLTWAYSPKMA